MDFISFDIPKIYPSSDLEKNLKKLKLDLKSYRSLKKKATEFSQKNPSTVFADRGINEGYYVLWDMQNRPRIETDYTLYLMRNSYRALELYKFDRPFYEIEEGILLYCIDPKINLTNITGFILNKVKYYEGLNKKYNLTKNYAFSMLKTVKTSLPYKRIETSDLKALIASVYKFTGLMLDYCLPFPIDKFLIELVPSYFSSLNDEAKRESINNLLIQPSGRNYFNLIQLVVLKYLLSLYRKRKSYKKEDIHFLIECCGFYARDGFPPCALETFEGMKNYLNSLINRYPSIQSINEYFNDLFFKQRINRINLWKEKEKLLENCPAKDKRYIGDILNLLSLSLEYNEENRIIRNYLFKVLFEIIRDYYPDQINKIGFKHLINLN